MRDLFSSTLRPFLFDYNHQTGLYKYNEWPITVHRSTVVTVLLLAFTFTALSETA